MGNPAQTSFLVKINLCFDKVFLQQLLIFLFINGLYFLYDGKGKTKMGIYVRNKDML